MLHSLNAQNQTIKTEDRKDSRSDVKKKNIKCNKEVHIEWRTTTIAKWSSCKTLLNDAWKGVEEIYETKWHTLMVLLRDQFRSKLICKYEWTNT